jgi:hypothetical protein
MIAATDHEDLAVRAIGVSGTKALPAAAIYGANASGKSNVLDALVFMVSAVLSSHQDWRPGAPLDRRAFKLDSISRQRPTRLIVDFMLHGVRHEYGFSIDDQQVLEEWLYIFPKKRTRVLFERDAQFGIRFGPSLGGLRQNIAKLTRSNSLYLSTAAANNHEQLSAIYDWFSHGIFAMRAGQILSDSYTFHEWKQHDQATLRELLRYADLGVLDLELEEQEGAPKVTFVHRGATEHARFTLEEESSGTLAWLRLIGPVASKIRDGGVLIIDELDAHLHPLLTAHLVSFFQRPEINTSCAQLLFNTHNTSLLAPSAPGRLRRDQVWFTEKGDDGATRLLALSEYRVRDGLENVEKRYLGGRYGAIPFLDDTAIDGLSGE